MTPDEAKENVSKCVALIVQLGNPDLSEQERKELKNQLDGLRYERERKKHNVTEG